MYVEGAYVLSCVEIGGQHAEVGSFLSLAGSKVHSSAIKLVASCFYLLRIHAVIPPHLLVYFHWVFFIHYRSFQDFFLVIGKNIITRVSCCPFFHKASIISFLLFCFQKFSCTWYWKSCSIFSFHTLLFPKTTCSSTWIIVKEHCGNLLVY